MIDTLKVAEQLKESGFDDKQAQSITYAITDNNEQLATKQDFSGVTQDSQRVTQDLQIIKQDIQDLKQDNRDLKQDNRGIKQDIKTNRWLIGLSLLLNTVTISGIIAILILIANSQ